MHNRRRATPTPTSASQAAIAAAAPASVEDVRARAQPLLAFSAEVEAEHLELKRYLRQHLYRHYKVLRMTTEASGTLAM